MRRDVDSVVKKEVFINYKRYEPVRIQTEPRIFKVPIIEDNAFEIKNSGITEAAAEGYWVFLKPLSKGHYSIRFEGSCENGRLSAGVLLARYCLIGLLFKHSLLFSSELHLKV